MQQKEAQLRFYEELNSFIPHDHQKKQFIFKFWGKPSIKDVIESLGVPHTEVDLILINGQSVDFQHHIRHGDRVSVYPMFESLDIDRVSQIRKTPLRKIKFILDVHLGKMAKSLRMLGFDSLYRNDYTDPEIVNMAAINKRIILTRDKGLLKFKKVTHGYWIRSDDPKRQVIEVLQRFDLFSQISPFHRCLSCNGLIKKIKREAVDSKLMPKTRRYYKEFYNCLDCGRIYWKGSHFQNMQKQINYIIENGLNNSEYPEKL